MYLKHTLGSLNSSFSILSNAISIYDHEYTKDITPEQRAELQEKVSNMTEEELISNTLNSDLSIIF